MYELMKRRKILMMKNRAIICSEYLQLQVIYQSYSSNDRQINQFLFSTFNSLCLEGNNLIGKCYDNANTIPTQ